MIRIALLMVMLVTPALAQQQPSPFDQALKMQLGELTFANTGLVTEMRRLAEENAALKKQVEELQKNGTTGSAKP